MSAWSIFQEQSAGMTAYHVLYPCEIWKLVDGLQACFGELGSHSRRRDNKAREYDTHTGVQASEAFHRGCLRVFLSEVKVSINV